MKNYDKKIASTRLKELRTGKAWSLFQMGEELNKRVGYKGSGKMNMDGDTGKQTVSQLERNCRGITIDIAFAYADIFGVSLDYVFGRTDSNKSVQEQIALDDGAIETLRTIPIKDSLVGEPCLSPNAPLRSCTAVLNKLLSPKNSDTLFLLLSDIKRYLDIRELARVTIDELNVYSKENGCVEELVEPKRLAVPLPKLLPAYEEMVISKFRKLFEDTVN